MINKKHANETTGVKEIARRANVSIGTVDRVIHNRTGVAEETRKKINGIIQELNYQPNILASRLASKKVYQINILIPHFSGETDFWDAPLKGINKAEEEIKNYGLSIEKYFFDLQDKNSFVKQAKRILKKKPDGVLLSPSFTKEAIAFTTSCKEKHIPVVFIDSNLNGQESLCYIGPNMFYSGYQVAHLTDFGTRSTSKILFLNISEENNNEETEKGFRAYFKDKNEEREIIKLNISKTDYLSVSKNLATIFHVHQDIQAIFVSNSRVSSVANFLMKAGFTNVLLIGYDLLQENIKYLEMGSIDFLICHKPEEQGYLGVMAFLQKLVLNTKVEPIHYMPIDIITKENYKFYRS